jgi:putative ABC transport system permease protein
MENLLQDLRFGFRSLTGNPGFSIIAIVALALGTGANTAIFSVVNGVLIRPLPYQNPHRLVLVWGRNPTTPRDSVSAPDFQDYRDHNQVFEGMCAFAYDDFVLLTGDEPEHLEGLMTSANYFSTLGVRIGTGRDFRPDEDQPGASHVAIISDGLWKRRFGANPALIGQTIQVSGTSFTVVGVAPPDFQSPIPEEKPQLWIPISLDGGDRLRVPSSVTQELLRNRRGRFLKVAARLKSGITLEQAQADLDVIASRLQEQYKDTNTGISTSLVPARTHIVGNVETALIILLASVALVLLIACANVANLLLARAAGRQKEIAIRAALGAGRLRLIRQLLTESLLLALVGGALGLALAYGGIRLLLALNPPNIPRLSEIGIDIRVLGFTFLTAIVTGLIFGLAPALEASKPDLNETLKEGSRGTTAGGQRVRSVLVVTEVALTVLLLIAAGLMLKSFYSLQRVNPGFDPENTMTALVNLSPLKYSGDKQIRSFYEQALERIKSISGVESAAAISSLPLTTTLIERLRFTVEGHPPPNPSEVPRANIRRISPAYFETMRIPLVDGRYFSERDREDSLPVVIVNQTMASRYWPGENPLGRRLTIPSMGDIPREVVGVVGDVKHSGLDAQAGPELYVPYLQKPFPFMTVVVRTTSDPLQTASALRGALLSVDSSQPVYGIKTMDQIVSESMSQSRLYSSLLATFAALAVTLAAVGIYGVMSYNVSQRAHEIGIRMALGAERRHILRMIVGEAMTLAVLGVLVGVGAAVALTRVMETLVFGVGVRDAATFAAVPVVLGLVAFLSCYVPARRATEVDPMIALRYE